MINETYDDTHRYYVAVGVYTAWLVIVTVLGVGPLLAVTLGHTAWLVIAAHFVLYTALWYVLQRTIGHRVWREDLAGQVFWASGLIVAAVLWWAH